MIAGFASFAILELLNILYAIAAGHLRPASETLPISIFLKSTVWLMASVGLIGIVVGLLFAYLHVKL
jgi:hypothetical protein